MFNMMAIGRHIAGLRREKDMTQMELADRLGITIKQYPNGNRANHKVKDTTTNSR